MAQAGVSVRRPERRYTAWSTVQVGMHGLFGCADRQPPDISGSPIRRPHIGLLGCTRYRRDHRGTRPADVQEMALQPSPAINGTQRVPQNSRSKNKMPKPPSTSTVSPQRASSSWSWSCSCSWSNDADPHARVVSQVAGRRPPPQEARDSGAMVGRRHEQEPFPRQWRSRFGAARSCSGRPAFSATPRPSRSAPWDGGFVVDRLPDTAGTSAAAPRDDGSSLERVRTGLSKSTIRRGHTGGGERRGHGGG